MFYIALFVLVVSLLYLIVLLNDIYAFVCVDWDGVRNLVSALPKSLKRIVLVSSIGVTKLNELPWR